MNSYNNFQRLANLIEIRNDLLSKMIFLEKSLHNGDFTNFGGLTKAKQKLKYINEKIEYAKRVNV
jgi:hypothetical protein